MPLAEATLSADGTGVRVTIDDIIEQSGRAVVTIGSEKDDFRADPSLDVLVFVEGLTAAEGVISPRSTYGTDGFFVDAAPGDEIDVSVSSGSDSVTLTTRYPVPFDLSKVTVESCSTPPESVEPGENATVTATIANANNTSGEVTVTASAGDATADETITLPANSSTTVEFTFAFDAPGQYEPAVEVA